MFSFFRSPSIVGVECTDQCVRVVHREKDGTRHCIKKALPMGAVSDGVVKDIPTCGEVIKGAINSLPSKPLSPSLSLCIPSEKVYYQLLKLAPAKLEKRARVHYAAEELLPEAWGDIAFGWKDIESKNDEQVAFAAVRQDVLQSHLGACKEAGFSVAHASGTSTLLGTALPAETDPSACMLLVREPHEHEPGTVTLFLQKHPIEEIVLWQGDDIIALTKTFIDQERRHERPITHIRVLGSMALLEQLKTMDTPAKVSETPKKKKGAEKESTAAAPTSSPYVIEQAIPDITEEEMEWMPATSASFFFKPETLSFL